MNRRLLIALALLANLSQPACAGHTDRQARIDAEVTQRFTNADVDADGVVTRNEAKDGMRQVYRHFDEIDIDEDGAVRLEEIKAYLVQQRAARQ